MLNVRNGLLVTVLGAGSMGLTGGCQNKLAGERDQLYQQNRELQARLADANARADAAPDPASLTQLQAQLVAKDQEIAQLQSSLRQPTPGAPAESNGLDGIEVTRDERAGTVTVNLPGDVLFASGSSDLKSSATATLNKVVAAVKKDFAGKKLFVDGHTDSDPISRTKDKWEDNLDLSAARARSVAKFLSGQGINASQIGTRAFGPTAPRGNKASSRRVEIVVVTR